MDDAKSYLGALAPEGAPELSSGVGELSSVFSGPSGSPGVPAKFQEPLPTVNGLERLAAGAAFFTPFFTARENVFKAMQNLGLGPTYSRIFKPIQEAINRVEYEMATVVRPELGGMSINKYLDGLQNKVFKVDKNRRKQLIDATEFLTKNEISAPGGFMPRGMNTLELSIAKQMEAFNLQGKLPPLLGSMRLARNILDSKEKFIKNYQKAIKEGRMTPEMQARWDKIYEDGETFKTVGDVYDALGLSIEERWAVEEMANGLKRKADDFSLAAVIRYTEAPELKSGFKTGREQFFSEHNFNPLEKKIVADIDQLLAFGFDRAGLDSKRQIGGYFPHFRKMVQQGFTTDDAWLKRDMPEFLNWIHERFRTGEINVYSKDPVLDSLRYMRGLLMKEHFDPILPEIKAARELIKAKDIRAGRLVDDYIDQAIGKPHVSFQKMQGWIQSAANAMGKNVPQHLVEDVVNNLVMLSYGATIPFRPALIARNWFQAVQTIPARTGWSSFMEGVQRAGTKEGWEELIKSGVIPRDQVPIFATSEIWRPGQLKLTRDLQRLVDRGFKWYKTPDDYGRAMAYFAQKSRVSKHMDDVMQGKIDYETFKQRAKIKTFDPMDEAMFDSYWAAGERDRAIDHVAASLARETHFRYGHANNPSGWNGVAGRLFGQFGTWPVQYKDFIVTGLTRGTTKDKAEFLMNIVGTNYGVVAAGAAVGLNLNNWINFSSLTYTGGPFAQMAVDLVKTQSGSDVEKRLARTNLIRQFPTWDDPRSLFVPGSYLLGDIMAGLEEPSLGSGLVRATGIRFLRPEDKTAIDWLLGR